MAATPDPTFSIIVPVWNSASHIVECVNSLQDQTLREKIAEVIFVDSGSSDDSVSLIESHSGLPTRVLRLGDNEGPGIARDAGVRLASGDYLLFVDSDDVLDERALEVLASRAVESSWPDVITFNWRSIETHSESSQQRQDGRFFVDDCTMLTQFLRHHMEGSVIFSAYRREFFVDHDLRHRSGLHEDIDFIFGAYRAAESVAYLNASLYLKRNHDQAVTHSMTSERIAGYLDAYRKCADNMQESPCSMCGTDHLRDSRIGLLNAIAALARRSVESPAESCSAALLLSEVYTNWKHGTLTAELRASELREYTLNGKVLRLLERDGDWEQKAKDIEGLLGFSWSCKDLQHSVFFAPDEIRTCCKRFFVDGERRGDVALAVDVALNQPVDLIDIQEAKRNLWLDINRGERTDCDKCPYLEWKRWEPLSETMSIHTISMEQHSVCNLRCTYCDETYFGGKRTSYDLDATLKAIHDSAQLVECNLIVWGGGEPLLDPKFPELITSAASLAPAAQHRVLSNALRFSPEVADLMAHGRAQLVTSLDAGDEIAFRQVRGRAGLARVLENLSRYSAIAADRVVLKYIFTEGNSTLEQCERFVQLVRQHNLQGCLLQLSSDFKEETLSPEVMGLVEIMHKSFNEMGLLHVYFDEHIWQRWGDLMSIEAKGEVWSEPGVDNEGSVEPLYLWGAGQLSRMLLEREGFAQRWRVKGVVDSRSQLVGSEFMGFNVADIEALADHSGPVFLATVQGMVEEISKFSAAGFEKAYVDKRMLW